VNTLLSFLIQSGTESVTPWFDPQTFGTYFGAFGGAIVGVLGGFFGAVGSWAAQRNKWRAPMLGSMTICGFLGVVSLITGLVALATGQPYGIWYPLALIGLVSSVCFIALQPILRKRYAEADSRRMEAHALRHS